MSPISVDKPAMRPPEKPTGIRGDIWAGKIALAEFIRQMASTRQIKIQVGVLALAIILGLIRHFGETSWLFVACVFFLSIHAEINNTAHELQANMHGEHYDDRVGKIKDVAAAGVSPMFFLAITVITVLAIWPL